VTGHGQGVASGDVLGHVGVPAERVGAVLAVGFRLPGDLAAVEGLALAEDLLLFFHGIGQAVQQCATLTGRQLGPARGAEGPVGGLDRPIDVVRLQGGHLGQRLPGAWVAGLKQLAVGRRDVLAANHALERALGKERQDFRQ